MNHTKLSKYLNWFLRLLIIIASYGYIYYQLVVMGKFWNLIAGLDRIKHDDLIFYLLVVVILLVPANWSLEALKWKYAISKLENISFWKAIKGVLTGLTVSTVSPNRVGEFFGRLFYLEKSNRVKAGLISIMSSFSQLIVTLMLGLISFTMFVNQYYKIHPVANILLYVVNVLLIMALLLIYLKMSKIRYLLGLLPARWFRKAEVYVSVLSYYSTLELLNILIYSFIRYAVFSFQFYLLMRIMGIEISYWEGMFIISLIYFLMSAIPTITLAELGLRGSVSMAVVEFYFRSAPDRISEMTSAALAASSMVWILNLVIPAIVGGLFLIHAKIVKE
jgi:hypothetical protein